MYIYIYIYIHIDNYIYIRLEGGSGKRGREARQTSARESRPLPLLFDCAKNRARLRDLFIYV